MVRRGRKGLAVALLGLFIVVVITSVREHAAAIGGQARIVFANGGRLFTIEADGASRTQLTGPKRPRSHAEIEDGDPSWSPDGTLIAFSRGEFSVSSRLMILNPTSGVVMPLTAPRTEARDYGSQWSPDGRQLVFVRFTTTETKLATSIMVINRDGSGEHAILTESFKPVAPPFTAVLQPVWSPDGSQIAYTRSVLRRDGTRQIALYAMKPDGTDRRLLARDGSAAAFSPDASQIAFASTRDRNGEVCGSDECGYESELYVMEADGTHQRRLTRNKGNDYDPDWSADGQRIVFSSNRSRPEAFGGEEVYLIRPDGSCLTWLTNGAPDSFAPDWEPDPAASTDPGGCGDTQRQPLNETDTRLLGTTNGFRFFWLGSQYRGLLLNDVDPYRNRYWSVLNAIYGDCARFDPRDCAGEVQLQEAPICRREKILISEAGLAKGYLTRRGALLVDFGYEGGMAVYTGRTYIKIYAGFGRDYLRDELAVVRGLRPFEREAPPEGGLPRAALPRDVLRKVRHALAAFRRLGTVDAVQERLGLREGAVRKRIRLARALEHYGPVRALDCPGHT